MALGAIYIKSNGEKFDSLMKKLGLPFRADCSRMKEDDGHGNRKAKMKFVRLNDSCSQAYTTTSYSDNKMNEWLKKHAGFALNTALKDPDKAYKLGKEKADKYKAEMAAKEKAKKEKQAARRKSNRLSLYIEENYAEIKSRYVKTPGWDRLDEDHKRKAYLIKASGFRKLAKAMMEGKVQEKLKERKANTTKRKEKIKTTFNTPKKNTVSIEVPKDKVDDLKDCLKDDSKKKCSSSDKPKAKKKSGSTTRKKRRTPVKKRRINTSKKKITPPVKKVAKAGSTKVLVTETGNSVDPNLMAFLESLK